MDQGRSPENEGPRAAPVREARSGYFWVVRVAFRRAAMSAIDVGMNVGSVLAGLLEPVTMVALDALPGELVVMR